MSAQEKKDPAFETLLQYLKGSRGFDFTEYKRASLMRRVNKRMGEVGIEGYEQYEDYLEVHPLEFTTLFNTILINVTSYFRTRRPGTIWLTRSYHASWRPKHPVPPSAWMKAVTRKVWFC